MQRPFRAESGQKTHRSGELPSVHRRLDEVEVNIVLYSASLGPAGHKLLLEFDKPFWAPSPLDCRRLTESRRWDRHAARVRYDFG
jgi:hypothetical protein